MTFIPPPPPAQSNIAVIPPPPPKLERVNDVDTGRDYITVITYDHPNGKVFSSDAGQPGYDPLNPKITKRPVFPTGAGYAQTFHVPDVETLCSIIESVQENDHQLIVIAYIDSTKPLPGMPHGERFRVLSKKEFVATTGIKNATKPHRQAGGELVACRDGNFMTYSSWVVFDLDNHPDIPASLRQRIDTEDYVDLLADLWDDLDDVDYVEVGSSSSRVMMNGVPCAKSNKHIYMRLRNVNDVREFGSSLLCRANGTEFWYNTNVRHGETGQILEDRAGQPGSIFDLAVFNIARQCFEGKPVLNKKDPHVMMGQIRVAPTNVRYVKRANDTIDGRALPRPTKEQQDAAKMRFTTSGGRFCLANNTDLTPGTRIEVKPVEGGESWWITMQEFAAGDVSRLRANNPFKRSSVSWAAFLSKENEDGESIRPFLSTQEFGKYTYNDCSDMFAASMVADEILGEETIISMPERLGLPEVPPAPPINVEPTIVDNDEVVTVPSTDLPVIPPPPPVETQGVAVKEASGDTVLPLPGGFTRDAETKPVEGSAEIITSSGVYVLDNNSEPGEMEKAIIDMNIEALRYEPFAVTDIDRTWQPVPVPMDMGENDMAQYLLDRTFGLNAKTLQVESATNHEGVTYEWNGRHWNGLEAKTIPTFVLRSLATSSTDKATDRNVRAVSNLMSLMCNPVEGREPLPKHYLPCKNGLFDWRTCTFGPFQKKYFYKKVAEFDFDPTAVGSGVFGKVIIDAAQGDPDFPRRLMQMIGYCAAGGRNDLQRIMMFKGRTRSGKSICGKILQAISPNVLSTSIGKLSDNKVVNNLFVKSLFYDDEATTPPFRDAATVAGIMKQVVSDSPLQTTKLYSDEMGGGIIHIKMAMACNKLPVLPDDEGALARRYEPIEFTRSYAEDKVDTAINDALDQPEELSAVLNMCIAGYIDLIKSNGYESVDHYHNSKRKNLKFHECKTSKTVAQALINQAAPLTLFIEEACEIGDEHRTTVTELVKAARVWAENEHVDFLAKSSNTKLRREIYAAMRNFGLDEVGGIVKGVKSDGMTVHKQFAASMQDTPATFVPPPKLNKL